MKSQSMIENVQISWIDVSIEAQKYH